MKQLKKPTISFGQFIEQFPEVQLPVSLGSEEHHTFSKSNPPLSALAIEQYIIPIEAENFDEYTEIIPCFRIPETHDFHAIIYWKANLMNYQYILATFEKNGQLIAQRTIAGTFFHNDVMTQSAVTIESDWMMYIVTGQGRVKGAAYDASTSVKLELELLSDGKIVESI